MDDTSASPQQLQRENESLRKRIAELESAHEELERSRSILAALMEHTTDFVLISDDHGRPVVFNSAYARVMKTALGIDMKPGLKPHTLLTDPAAVEWWENLHRRVLGGETFRVEYPHTFDDGTTRHFEFCFTPIRDGDEVTGFSELARDITDRVRACEENVRLERELHESRKMEAIGTLAGGIAHDFNNALVGVLGYADLIEESASDPAEVCAAAKVIRRAATRAADLTRQLLGFARRGKLTNRPIDMHDLIADVTAGLVKTVEGRIDITQTLGAERAVVVGDYSQLQQVVASIGANAQDAMPGKGHLTFETSVVDLAEGSLPARTAPSPGRHFSLKIRDSGCGMSPEVASRVFEPFFTTKQQGEGTGMGLAMVYGIVTNHGGQVTVQSRPGSGSTFEVLLPLAADDQVPNDDAAVPSAAHGSKRVLVIDDEDIVRTTLAAMLRTLDHEPHCCANGGEGIAYYREHSKDVDLVLLDIAMPDMDGRQCFEELRGIDPAARVVAITGNAPGESTRRLLSDGVLSSIQKPVRVAALRDAVARALRM